MFVNQNADENTNATTAMNTRNNDTIALTVNQNNLSSPFKRALMLNLLNIKS